MDDDRDDDAPLRRWKVLPHSKTHRILVLVVLAIVVAIMIRIAS